MSEFKKGDKVTWNTIHGPREGVIIGFSTSWAIVGLPSKRCVIIDEGSMRHVTDEDGENGTEQHFGDTQKED